MNDSEISLLSIFIFVKQSYKPIVLVGFLGVVISICYILIMPKQYQASALIQMAQVRATNNNIINSPIINIEEPSLLITRFSSPTSYTAEITKACGLETNKDAQAILSRIVKLSIPKGVANVVELKINGASPMASIVCAQAVFDLIKASQDQITKPYIDEAKANLLDYEEQLAKAKEFVLKADKSGLVIGAAYLLTRDEIRFLLDEIAALKNIVATNDNRTTRLISPIYASDDPIAPKKRNILLAGLFGGLFLGLLIAFWCQSLPSLKAELGKK